MELIHLLYFIPIGIAAGWLASHLFPGEQRDWLGNLIVGTIGSIVGGIALSAIGLGPINVIGRLVSATAGACLCILALRAIGKRPF